MGDTTRGPAIRGAWIFWVPYIVQPRTRVADLLERAVMTEAEWNYGNPGRPASKPLRTGDQVWIKDPIATCKMNKTDFFRFAEGVPLHLFSFDCEEMYSSFKPLRAFIKTLQVKK